MVDLRVDPDQDQNGRMVAMLNDDTGERRWYDWKVLGRMLKAKQTEDEIWEAGATAHDMFELNTLLEIREED